MESSGPRIPSSWRFFGSLTAVVCCSLEPRISVHQRIVKMMKRNYIRVSGFDNRYFDLVNATVMYRIMWETMWWCKSRGFVVWLAIFSRLGCGGGCRRINTKCKDSTQVEVQNHMSAPQCNNTHISTISIIKRYFPLLVMI